MKGKSYRAAGGKVSEGVDVSDESPSEVYAGEGSNVVKEARERTSKFKKGGKVSAFDRGRMSEAMEEAEEHRAKKKSGGCAEGGMARHRADRAPRKGRAAGGPLSTAAKVTKRPGGDVTDVE